MAILAKTLTPSQDLKTILIQALRKFTVEHCYRVLGPNGAYTPTFDCQFYMTSILSDKDTCINIMDTGIKQAAIEYFSSHCQRELSGWKDEMIPLVVETARDLLANNRALATFGIKTANSIPALVYAHVWNALLGNLLEEIGWKINYYKVKETIHHVWDLTYTKEDYYRLKNHI